MQTAYTDSLASPVTGLRQFATFVVDGLLFGVDVLSVQEVIRHQPMTRVPCAPGVVEGLINLRGQIVTAIDMRRRLGLTTAGEDLLSMNVVVRADDEVVSLLVDEIGDVVEVQPAQFETPPDTIAPAVRDVVTGIYKLAGRLLLVADVDRVSTLDAVVD